MFEIDHGNLPKGDEYREMRQFINSMELRNQVERYGCHAITIVTCDYRDRQSGEQCRGQFVALMNESTEPVLLIAEKKGGKGGSLFKYEATPEGRWSNAVPVDELAL